MASDSSSSSRFKHDVFLSFRGDTLNNFTSYLYEALKRKGIGTYADFDGPKKGEELSPALSKAIEESKASLVVLSENYASSSWSLDELAKIMECKHKRQQIVVPIFYNVDPSDIRKQTGSFGKALAEHEKTRPLDKVRRWRSALAEAAGLSGWPLTGDRRIQDYIS